MLNNGNINSITIINYLYFCLSVNRAIQQRVYEILSFFDLQKSLLNYLEPEHSFLRKKIQIPTSFVTLVALEVNKPRGYSIEIIRSKVFTIIT